MKNPQDNYLEINEYNTEKTSISDLKKVALNYFVSFILAFLIAYLVHPYFSREWNYSLSDLMVNFLPVIQVLLFGMMGWITGGFICGFLLKTRLNQRFVTRLSIGGFIIIMASLLMYVLHPFYIPHEYTSIDAWGFLLYFIFLAYLLFAFVPVFSSVYFLGMYVHYHVTNKAVLLAEKKFDSKTVT